MATRILLLGVPRLVRDLLHDAFSAQPGVSLLHAEEHASTPSDESLDAIAPDAVIVWRSAPAWPDAGSDIWRRYPSAMLVVETDGREITMYDRVPRRTRLSGESATELAERIRRALMRIHGSPSGDASKPQNPSPDP